MKFTAINNNKAAAAVIREEAVLQNWQKMCTV